VRFTIRDKLWLSVTVLIGAMFCGTLNAAISGDSEEAIYQWICGMVFGGAVAAIAYWLVRAFSHRTT
jgi:hypothetical protein